MRNRNHSFLSGPPAAQQHPDIISLKQLQQTQTHLLTVYRHILELVSKYTYKL